jgi:hypothetical protein
MAFAFETASRALAGLHTGGKAVDWSDEGDNRQQRYSDLNATLQSVLNHITPPQEEAAGQRRTLETALKLPSFRFPLLILRRRLDFSALYIHCGTQTANQILAKSKFIVIGNEARHLRIDELLAEQLVRRHVGQGTQFLDGKF